MRWAFGVLVAVALSAGAVEASVSELQADLESVRTQVAEAEEEAKHYEGGAILILIHYRLAALRATEALLVHRIHAVEAGVPMDFSVILTDPDPDRAEAILLELANAQDSLAELEKETTRYSGGLLKNMALLNVATQRMNIATLQLAYYHAQYGLLPPSMETPPESTTVEPETQPGPEANIEDDERALIVNVHRLLALLGYDPGESTGRLTLGLELAIVEFEHDMSLRETGLPSKVLIEQLNKAISKVIEIDSGTALEQIGELDYRGTTIISPLAQLSERIGFREAKSIVAIVLMSGYRCDTLFFAKGVFDFYALISLTEALEDPYLNIRNFGDFGVNLGAFDERVIRLHQARGDEFEARKYVMERLAPLIERAKNEAAAVSTTENVVGCDFGTLKYKIFVSPRAGGLPIAVPLDS